MSASRNWVLGLLFGRRVLAKISTVRRYKVASVNHAPLRSGFFVLTAANAP